MAAPDWQRALVDRLVADAAPVRRLWAPEARLLVWLGIVVAALVVAAWGALRPDVARCLRTPAFLLEQTSVLLGAALLGLAALRAAVPGQSLGRTWTGVAMLGLALWVLLLLRGPAHQWTAMAFLDTGVPCVRRALFWAAVPWVTLLAAVQRGAPLGPARAGALAGVAALGLTAVAVRLACSMDESAHLAVFHAIPVAMGTALSAGLGAMLLARWRRS